MGRLIVRVDSVISSIARLGAHELAVTEAIYRLGHAGDTAIDVGANLGYYTSLLAHGVGSEGTVYSFEPDPALHERLCHNVSHLAGVRVYQRAVSDHEGNAFLNQPDDLALNMGARASPTVASRSRSADHESLVKGHHSGPVLTSGLQHDNVRGLVDLHVAAATRAL